MQIQELRMIDELGVSELSEAVTAYRTVTLSPEFQEMARIREHNEASALYNAEQRGREEGREEGYKEANLNIARKLKNAGTMTIAEIAELTGLSTEEIEFHVL